MKLSPHSKVIRILLYIALGITLAGDATLIVEAAIPGSESAAQSNITGSLVASLVNDGTDATKLIEPENVVISSPSSSIFKIGDTYQISASVEPEDSSYKSLSYYSSDESLATVSSSGLVSFLNKGNVDITAKVNYDGKDVYSSISFLIEEVEVESIEVSISSASKDEEGNYLLTTSNSYSLSVNVSPSNATNKNYYFEIEEGYESYLSGNTLKPTSSSSEPITLYVYSSSNNEVYSSLSFIVSDPVVVSNPDIELEGISFASDTISTISIGQSLSLASNSYYKPVFSPSNATNKGYSYSIVSGGEYASLSGTTLKGVAEGSVTLRLTSTYNPQLYAEKQIEVAVINLTSITMRSSVSNLFTMTSASISFSSASPSNATAYLNKWYTIESSDSSIISITSSTSTSFKALAVGSATITATFYNSAQDRNAKTNAIYTAKLDLEVKEPSEIASFTYSVNSSKYETSVSIDNQTYGVFLTDKTYSLSSFVTLNNYYDSDGNQVSLTQANMSSSYTLSIYEFEGNDDDISFASNSLKITSLPNPSKAYYLIFELTHNDSNISYTFTCYVVSSYIGEGSISSAMEDVDELASPSTSSSITFEGNSYPLIDAKSAYIGSDYLLQLSEGLTYSITYLEQEGDNLYEEISFFDNLLDIRLKSAGTLLIKITPYYEGIGEIDSLSKVAYISTVSYVSTLTDFNFEIYDLDSESALQLTNDPSFSGEGKIIDGEEYKQLSSYLNADYQLRLYKGDEDKNPTVTDFKLTSDDESVVSFTPIEVDGCLEAYSINFHKVGSCSICISESYSNKEVTIKIKVKNYTEYLGYTLSQSGYSSFGYNEEEDAWHIRNGLSATLTTLFSEESTFTQVSYESEDSDILTIGSDGVISPLSLGTTKIHAYINDEDSVSLSYSITITVDSTPVIEDINSFLSFFRKLVGHFGAFLLLAIASCSFFLVGFDRERWIYSVPISLGHGLGLAVLTELIQLFVPGRSGNWTDVWTDFKGYLIGFAIVVFFVVLFYTINHFRKKKANKNEDKVSKSELEENNEN